MQQHCAGDQVHIEFPRPPPLARVPVTAGETFAPCEEGHSLPLFRKSKEEGGEPRTDVRWPPVRPPDPSDRR